MSDVKCVQEKKPYVDKAAELKQEYKRALESDIAGDGDVRLIHCSCRMCYYYCCYFSFR